ncbi:MAG: cytochrome c family protein, partial [Flavobacteriaceae bacterium]|nr:cytochrome c family protein [Flavobacteriaceae bacterium]
MKTLLLFTGILLMLSCNSPLEDSYTAMTTEVETTLPDPEHPGKALMEKNCYACHNAATAHEDRIAPPMIAVKKHYISEDTSKEEFTEAILNWTKEPSEDKAKMYGAVKRFGVMPYQSFPEETIRQISEYLYDYDIEEPEWFAE